MARETAATFDLKLEEPEIKIENEVDNIKDYFDGVEIKTDKCSTFFAKAIKDVKITDQYHS